MNGKAVSTTAARPTPQAVLELYGQRDAMASEEQKLEDEIFGGRTWAEPEAKEMIERYRSIKLARMELSLQGAFLFMQLGPSDKIRVTSEWSKSQAAKAKSEGSGLRGIPHIKMGVF